MSGELIIAAILIVVANIVMYKIKYEQNRLGDLTLDLGAMFFLNYIFAGTMTGMVIAMGASFLLGIYFYFYPPKMLA